MKSASYHKCKCGHTLDHHTYSEDYQGCDLCNCTYNLGDELANAKEEIKKMVDVFVAILHDRPSAHTDDIWQAISEIVEKHRPSP